MTIALHLDDQGDIKQAARSLDWGALVEIHQGGIDIHAVGLDSLGVENLLRNAAQ